MGTAVASRRGERRGAQAPEREVSPDRVLTPPGAWVPALVLYDDPALVTAVDQLVESMVRARGGRERAGSTEHGVDAACRTVRAVAAFLEQLMAEDRQQGDLASVSRRGAGALKRIAADLEACLAARKHPAEP